MAAPTDILTDLRGPLLSAKDMFLSKLKDRQLADSFKLITMDDLCNTEKELELQIRGLKNARGSGRIEPLIKAHKEYGGVLETVVQAGPEILCLSWGPLKALLLVPSTEKQAYDMVVIMLGELGQSFPDFKPYETWFLQSEDLCRRLPVFFEDLLQVYAKSLRVFESRSTQR
ncbi:hypothetical protein QBC35DRAFT_392718 [Podospora australis]|uniref:DUF7708 domain-containing protein n=1 Tax=Podospora australis TaxID=1536484 RepID=A0AAN6WMC2_9PEZI|nr:hypothetical protein QBC35DRAFT_392718 [Podospora australis]